MPERPDPAITLADLKAILEEPSLLLPGAEAKSLDSFDYRYLDGEMPQPIRVTVDPGFYEMHADSVEFWTPGSPAFPDLRVFDHTGRLRNRCSERAVQSFTGACAARSQPLGSLICNLSSDKVVGFSPFRELQAYLFLAQGCRLGTLWRYHKG